MTNTNVVRYGNIVDFKARFQVLQNINVTSSTNSILVEEVASIPLPINDRYLHLTVSTQYADFLMFGDTSTNKISIYCRQTNGLATGTYITLVFTYICN
jgi:hypothetical protein